MDLELNTLKIQVASYSDDIAYFKYKEVKISRIFYVEDIINEFYYFKKTFMKKIIKILQNC